MDNIVDFPKTETPELLIGPFQEYRVSVEGRIIPHLTGNPKGERDGEVMLVVDNRFGISIPVEIAYQVAWLVAQGMAVASGYSSLNAESKEMPFAPKGMSIGPGAP